MGESNGDENQGQPSDEQIDLIKMAIQKVKVLEPVIIQTELSYVQQKAERRFIIGLVIFDSLVLAYTIILLFIAVHGEKGGACYATRELDYPFSIDDVDRLGIDKFVNVTHRFTIILSVFVANFTFTLAVDISKIIIKFDTRFKYRILILLRFVHVVSFIDLLIITYMRYNHNGATCFCHNNEVDPEWADNCMSVLHFPVEMLIYILWGVVGLILIAIIVVSCYACRRQNRSSGKITESENINLGSSIVVGTEPAHSQSGLGHGTIE